MTGSDPKSDLSNNPKVATHSTNGNFTQILLISRFVPMIVPVTIGPIHPLITADVMVVQDVLSPRQTVLLKESVTDAAGSCTHIFRGTPGKVSQTSREDATPRGIISDENSRLISPILVSNPTSVFPAHFGNQDIIS